MKSIISILFSIVLLSCSAQDKGANSEKYRDVSNDEAKELMAIYQNLQIIDVRQNAEVAGGMIDGAVQMDISKPAFYEQIETLDKNAPVLVYCAAGGRSKTAQEIMQENGFKEVHNLKRGYGSWK
jgi:rhodanese-related sulfurtransferase